MEAFRAEVTSLQTAVKFHKGQSNIQSDFNRRREQTTQDACIWWLCLGRQRSTHLLLIWHWNALFPLSGLPRLQTHSSGGNARKKMCSMERVETVCGLCVCGFPNTVCVWMTLCNRDRGRGEGLNHQRALQWNIEDDGPGQVLFWGCGTDGSKGLKASDE